MPYDTTPANGNRQSMVVLSRSLSSGSDYYFINMPGEVITRASPIGCEPVALSYPGDPDKTALIGPVNNEEWTRINGVMRKTSPTTKFAPV